MQKPVFPLYILPLLFFFFSFFSPPALNAGIHYSSKELMAQGIRYVSVSTQWKSELDFHNKRLTQIKTMRASDAQKQFLYDREMARHGKRNHDLAGQRNEIQEVLIKEANARVQGSQGKASSQLKDTAGTKFGEKGHRGMAGDRDMGGGSNTAEKVKDVLREMGLYNPDPSKKSIVPVESKAGTLEIKGEFDLTINKEGMAPRAGTQYHQIQVEVDARNPETYVSESMKIRKDGKLVKQQVGTEYVEIQDHRKKASKGLAADGEGLVREPSKMQGMAKGTKKTLDMGRVDGDTLEKILRQNGIKESPAEFKRRLQAVKEGKISIGDAGQAERMRRVSEDVFAAAEQTVFRQAKKDIVDLRAKAASMSPDDPVRLKIEEEIVDTVTKMKQTRAANEEFLSAKKMQNNKAVVKEIPPPQKKITPEAIDVEIRQMELSRPASVKQKAAKAFGAIMQIADIGQTCQTVEDYVAGKIPLTDAALTIADQYVTQGAIGTGKHIAQTSQDYMDARDKIAMANRNNMAAYLTRWELGFRRAGMPADKARAYVSNAMLSGDLTLLDRKANLLRAEGRQVEAPVLVTETFEADDTLWERTKATGKGMATGIYDGAVYSINAPGRMVDAWAEGELKEAHLAAYTREQDAGSRSTLFQKLISAGVPSQKALAAINAHENNDLAPLRALFRETRERIKAEEEAARKEAQAAETYIQDQAARLEKGLHQYGVYLEFLKSTPLILNREPSPIEIPSEGESVVVEFSMDNPQDNFLMVAGSMENLFQNITGTPAKVIVDYNFGIPGKPGATPNIWYTKSPKTAGIYPVPARVDVKIKGPGPDSPLAALAHDFTRPVYENVEVVAAGGDADYTKGIWPELRKTTVTDMAGKITRTKGAARVIDYDWEANTGTTDKEWGHVTIKMSADGRRIEEVVAETFYDWESRNKFKELVILKNFVLYSLDKETLTQPTHAYYVMDDDNKDIYGTYQKAEFDRKKGTYRTYGTPQVLGDARASNSKVVVHMPPPRIHFRMSQEIQEQKWAREKEVRAQKKAAQKARKKAASGGSYFEGPMGEEEGFTGKIKIRIGKDQTSVDGEFKCTQIKTRGSESRKAVLEGTFQGAFNPETGALETKLTNGNMWFFKKVDGKWYPGGPPQGMSTKTRVLGKMENNQINGYIDNGKAKAFHWTALPTPPGEGK
ncbi:MAG: hypothetical protein HUN04_12090 [Desulfobacter sp.]|nr:MAG: hypothetical protein HUN04_12090 [Desulfobacter sp.]